MQNSQPKFTKAERDRLFNEVFLQPWFVTLETSWAIRRLLPPDYIRKLKYYFEDYGCLRCGKTDRPHDSNAMCKPCVAQVKLRFLFALKRRGLPAQAVKKRHSPFDRMAEAKRLLADLVEPTGITTARLRR